MSIIQSPTNVDHNTLTPVWGGTCAKRGSAITYDAEVPPVGDLYVPDDKSYQSPKRPDSESWSRIKKSGFIKMTPYSRLRWSEKNTPVAVRKYNFDIGWPACTDSSWFGAKVVVTSSWDDWYHANSDLPSIPMNTQSFATDLDAERNSLRASVVSDNLRTYDLLTELVEYESTLKMIMSIIKSIRHPLESFRDFKKSMERRGDLSPQQVHDRINQKWLEYRYAIMPAVYSLQDIVKLVRDRNNVYKTSRRSKNLSYRAESKFDRSQKGIFLYTRERVDIKLRATGKALYNTGELQLRLIDQIGFNPFVTAWELIPWSFVVDWFANIGDWVLAQTSSVTDGSSQRVFCESIKIERVVETVLYANLSFQKKVTYNDHRKGVVDSGVRNVFVERVVREYKEDSYSRDIFTPSDVNLSVDAFLNWKRLLDAWALSQKPIIKGLRSLK